MLLDKFGKQVTHLLVDSGCFPLCQRATSTHVKLYFPSLLMLELNEFCGEYPDGLPKVNPIFTDFVNYMFINKGAIIEPSFDDIFGSSKRLDAIQKFRKKVHSMTPGELGGFDEATRGVFGRLKSPTKSEKESLRFDAIFYTMAKLKYIHDKQGKNWGYLSDGIHDNNLLMNASYWELDGVERMGIKVDPYQEIPPVFTWEDFTKSKISDVQFVPPRQLFFRHGSSHEVFLT